MQSWQLSNVFKKKKYVSVQNNHKNIEDKNYCKIKGTGKDSAPQ